MSVFQKSYFENIYGNLEKYMLKQQTKMLLSFQQAYQECKYFPLYLFQIKYLQYNKKEMLSQLNKKLLLMNVEEGIVYYRVIRSVF